LHTSQARSRGPGQGARGHGRSQAASPPELSHCHRGRGHGLTDGASSPVRGPSPTGQPAASPLCSAFTLHPSFPDRSDRPWQSCRVSPPGCLACRCQQQGVLTAHGSLGPRPRSPCFHSSGRSLRKGGSDSHEAVISFCNYCQSSYEFLVLT